MHCVGVALWTRRIDEPALKWRFEFVSVDDVFDDRVPKAT